MPLPIQQGGDDPTRRVRDQWKDSGIRFPASPSTTSGASEQPLNLLPASAEPPQLVPPVKYLRLLAELRNTLGLEQHINDYLRVAAFRFRGTNVEIVQSPLEGEQAFADFVHTAQAEFTRMGLDLSVMVLEALKLFPSVKDKSILAATLLVLNESAFVNQYLMPVLQKKSNIPASGQNIGFCLFLLKGLDVSDVERLFRLVDFQYLDGVEKLTETIASMNEPIPEHILEALVTISNKLDSSFPVNEPHPHRKLIHRLVLATADKLQKASKKVSPNPIKEIYRTTEDTKISDMAIARLSAIEGFDKESFLAEVIEDKGDVSRLTKFWAINDLFSASIAGVNRLADTLVTLDDLFLSNLTVYKLVADGGDNGKKKVVEAINKKIKLNEPSLPLAIVCSMLGRDTRFVDAFKIILASEYLPARGLETGFANMRDLKLATMERNDEGGLTFGYDAEIISPSVVDVFQTLGISTIAEWAMNEQSAGGVTQHRIEENMVNLIIYAYRNYSQQMRSLMAAAFLGKTRVQNYLLGLVGDTQVGKRDDKTTTVMSFLGFDLSRRK